MSEEQDKPTPTTNPLQPGGFINKRREKVVAEIERNRRGEYKVPTWVLVVILLVLVGGIFALIISG